MIAALYVQKDGCYFGLPDVDPWPEERDARKYAGPFPVVAHPSCSTWCQLARVNEARWGKRVGDDGGCFASALESVCAFGGVLEHPAESLAWPRFGLPEPLRTGGWLLDPFRGGWVCEVWQSAYGHLARKRTWLYAFGVQPPSLNWSHPEGTHQVGWFDRKKPTLGKKAASATPPPFRDLLIGIARSVRIREAA